MLNLPYQQVLSILEQDTEACLFQSSHLYLTVSLLCGTITRKKDNFLAGINRKLLNISIVCRSITVNITQQKLKETERNRQTERVDNSKRVVKVVFMPRALAP